MNLTTKLTSLLIVIAFFSFSCNQQAKTESSTATEYSPGADGLDRTSLPIKEPDYAEDITIKGIQILKRD